MPVYDGDKIIKADRIDYAGMSERARFEHRIRCAAFDMVECSGMAVEEVATVLALVAKDVYDSVERAERVSFRDVHGILKPR